MPDKYMTEQKHKGLLVFFNKTEIKPSLCFSVLVLK